MSSITNPSPVATSSSASREPRAARRGGFARIGLATVIAAVLANTVVYFIGSALVGYDQRFLPLANVSGAIVFTLPAAIVAVLLYAALLRFARKPARTFTIIAAVVFIATANPGLHLHSLSAGRNGRADRRPCPDARHRRVRDRRDADDSHAPAGLIGAREVSRCDHSDEFDRW